jgi:hypothetical protein
MPWLPAWTRKEEPAALALGLLAMTISWRLGEAKDVHTVCMADAACGSALQRAWAAWWTACWAI